MGKRTVIMHLSGSAERVFSLLRYFSVNWGELNLGKILELSREKPIPTFVSKVKRQKGNLDGRV